MENKNFTVEELALEIAHHIGSLGVKIEGLKHAKSVLGRMALDAKDKYVDKLQPYFLWDNNDNLQTVDNVMFYLLKEIDEEYKQIKEMHSQLHNLTKAKGARQ